MKILLELFWTFFKIGSITIGGGYVMLPMIQKEIVQTKKWASDEEVIDYYAIGQSTPGIIAVNTATFIGYKLKKIPGAVAATLGMVCPSLIIILTIAIAFEHFEEIALVQSAFRGIRIAVIAVLIHAVYKMGKKTVKDWIGIIFAATAFVVVAFAKISPIWVILISAALGIAIRYRAMLKHDREKEAEKNAAR